MRIKGAGRLVGIMENSRNHSCALTCVYYQYILICNTFNDIFRPWFHKLTGVNKNIGFVDSNYVVWLGLKRMGFHAGRQKQRYFGLVSPDISGHIVQGEKSGDYQDFMLSFSS